MASAPSGWCRKRDPGVADDRGGGPLLGLAQRREGERVGVGVLTALVAAGAAHQPALGAGVDPAGGRPGRPELGVVGVRGDDHEPGRPPGVVGSGGGLVGRVSVIVPARRERIGRLARVTTSVRRLELVERGEDLGRVALRLDLWPDAGDPAVRPDQERGPRRAPVGLAVVLLLDPRAVGVGDRVVLVGEQRERQLELLAEGALAGRTLGLTPQTSAPRSWMVSLRSRNSHASTVQPGVSSLG